MVYGAIYEKNEYLINIFESIKNKQTKYNWLITDCVCYPKSPKIEEKLNQEYCFISGEELTEFISEESFQLIWAVFSAFDKSIELSDILKYSLPYADGYRGFWKKPLSIQHPLAQMEIVSWDSTLTLLFSKNKADIDSFLKYYPKSELLESYIDGQ